MISLRLFATLLLFILLAGTSCQSAEEKVFPFAGGAYPASAAELDQAHDQYERLVVMFHAPWCSACMSLKPRFQELAEVYRKDNNVRFLLVDATEEVALGLQFDVQYYPLVVLIKNSEVWHWERGTTVTLAKFAASDFNPGENKYSSFTGPYSRFGLWKYRVGRMVQFLTKFYLQHTIGTSTSYKLLWLLGFCSMLATLVVAVVLSSTLLFQPKRQREREYHLD